MKRLETSRKFLKHLFVGQVASCTVPPSGIELSLFQDREVAGRWEELAEVRHQQLLMEEAQMLQMQQRLEQGVDAFAEQHSSYAQCLQHFAQEGMQSGCVFCGITMTSKHVQDTIIALN